MHSSNRLDSEGFANLDEGLLGGLVLAGVIASRVLEAVLDGRVPDHDAAVVVGQDGAGQLLEIVRLGQTLGTDQDGVSWNSDVDGEVWKGIQVTFIEESKTDSSLGAYVSKMVQPV